MKLIDLLVKELPRRGGWPEGALNATQDKDGHVCFSAGAVPEFGYVAWEGGDWLWLGNEFYTTRASDYDTTIITCEQYESAIAASKAAVGHDGWIQWAGGECPVDSDAIVEVKYRNPNRYRYSNDRAGDFDWSHDGIDGDIIAYRLQQTGINSRANDERLEKDLNECIGQDVDAPEWNGEGLPPVGLICEGRFPRHPGISFEWQECLVLYVFERECAVKSKSTSTLHYCDEFRPLRTKAERKREAAAKEMARHANSDPHRKFNAGLRNCLSIYDAIAAGKIPGVKLEEE